MAHADVAESIQNAFVRDNPVGGGEIAAQLGKRVGQGGGSWLMRWPAKPNDPRTSRRRYANVQPLPPSEIRMTTIAILDDDHVIRLTRYAISGAGEITSAWARDFFMPEEMDPARVYALGNGLHEADGVSLIPMAAKVDLRKG